jgi:hypothetical protein
MDYPCHAPLRLQPIQESRGGVRVGDIEYRQLDINVRLPKRFDLRLGSV